MPNQLWNLRLVIVCSDYRAYQSIQWIRWIQPELSFHHNKLGGHEEVSIKRTIDGTKPFIDTKLVDSKGMQWCQQLWNLWSVICSDCRAYQSVMMQRIS